MGVEWMRVKSSRNLVHYSVQGDNFKNTFGTFLPSFIVALQLTATIQSQWSIQVLI